MMTHHLIVTTPLQHGYMLAYSGYYSCCCFARDVLVGGLLFDCAARHAPKVLHLDVAPCPPVIDHKLKVNNIIVQSLLSTMYTGVPLMTDIT